MKKVDRTPEEAAYTFEHELWALWNGGRCREAVALLEKRLGSAPSGAGIARVAVQWLRIVGDPGRAREHAATHLARALGVGDIAYLIRW